MLQTRNGKRTAAAAIRIACDLIDEGMISEKEALMQIDAKSLDMLLHPTFDAKALKDADKNDVVGKAKYKPYLLVELCAKCLEGTTERSDGNRGRSPRIDKAKYKPYLLVELCAKCLEGTTERKRW